MLDRSFEMSDADQDENTENTNNNEDGGRPMAITDENDSEANAETDEDAGMDTVCETCGCEEQEHDAHLCPVEGCEGDKIICNVCEEVCGPCHAHNEE